MPRGEVSSEPAQALDGLVDHMAARLRRLGTRHWRERLGADGGSAADVVHEAVCWCARRESELNPEPRPAAASSVPERPAYDAALADQLAVVGRDLAIAVSAYADQEAAEEVLAHLTEVARTLRITPRTTSNG